MFSVQFLSVNEIIVETLSIFIYLFDFENSDLLGVFLKHYTTIKGS